MLILKYFRKKKWRVLLVTVNDTLKFFELASINMNPMAVHDQEVSVFREIMQRNYHLLLICLKRPLFGDNWCSIHCKRKILSRFAGTHLQFLLDHNQLDVVQLKIS